ncbi:hypothetical protein [Rubellimicrobium aerolatum]|uniref:Transposase n=1 Tax=Rubellimicrobium aerolatum TaxID=490979 RepID=A0ABW0S8L3_9RHOB|nr:hypothetical protein [Rubellimicrobium aerolatum]MBP1804181.1 transposase InsO family protein [Rubellimicrobium aerolatum]
MIRYTHAELLGRRPAAAPAAIGDDLSVRHKHVLGAALSLHGHAQVPGRNGGQFSLGLLPTWFEDTNTHHPHSGLTMRSPRKFIAAQTATA